jgi:hypothetical protein
MLMRIKVSRRKERIGKIIRKILSLRIFPTIREGSSSGPSATSGEATQERNVLQITSQHFPRRPMSQKLATLVFK